MDIIETDWGLANTIDGRIELNKHLREFPELRQLIISHEFEHLRVKGFWKNRKVDALTEIRFSDLWVFYKKYPKTFFQQMSPISYIKGTLYFEWSLLILYFIYLGIGIGIFFLIKTFSADSQMFWRIIKYTIIGLTAVFGLYLLGKKLSNQKKGKKVLPPTIP